VEACTRETRGTANQTAQTEVDGTYTEEGLLCHGETGFVLEPPRTIQKRAVQKELDKNDKQGS